jgi:hypothetical protein
LQDLVVAPGEHLLLARSLRLHQQWQQRGMTGLERAPTGLASAADLQQTQHAAAVLHGLGRQH